MKGVSLIEALITLLVLTTTIAAIAQSAAFAVSVSSEALRTYEAAIPLSPEHPYAWSCRSESAGPLSIYSCENTALSRSISVMGHE